MNERINLERDRGYEIRDKRIKRFLWIALPLTLLLVMLLAPIIVKDDCNECPEIFLSHSMMLPSVSDDAYYVIQKWEKGLEKKDIEKLMNLYSFGFQGRGMNYMQMWDYNTNLFNEFSQIDVSIKNITYTYDDSDSDKILVKFILKTTLDGYSDRGFVEMVMVDGYDGMKIVSESWRPY